MFRPAIPVLACALIVASSAAFAHKIGIDIVAAGQLIEGDIDLVGGGTAPAGTKVEIFGPNGVPLGVTFTDAAGAFSFKPTRVVDHRFRADLGAGHVIERTFLASELPAVLLRANSLAATTMIAPDFEAMVADAVRREVKPLRKELIAYKEKNDFQNILGGLGYICGIFGLLFFIRAKRRKDV